MGGGEYDREASFVEDVDPATQLQPNGIDIRLERVQRLTSPALLGMADAVPLADCSPTIDVTGRA